MRRLLLIAMCGACAATMPTPAQEADVVAYALETDACIDNAHTLQESRDCRAAVRVKHGRADGGTP